MTRLSQLGLLVCFGFLGLIPPATPALSFAEQSTIPRGEVAFIGWELNFSNKIIEDSEFGEELANANETNHEYMKKINRRLKTLGAEWDFFVDELEGKVSWYEKGTITVVPNGIAHYRVRYPDGFWFQFSYDTRTVEVQIKPSTANELRKNVHRLQDHLFQVIEDVGLKPSIEETHNHIGYQKTFDADPKQFRNALVDAINNQEFAFLFNSQMYDAPPLSLLGNKKVQEFKNIIRDFDDGKFKDFNEFISAIRQRVYDITVDTYINESTFNRSQKFQQLNIERMKGNYSLEHKTLENRSIPHPQDAEQLAELSELTDGRMAFLKENKSKRIAFRKFNKNAPLAYQVALFKRYVEESGLDYEKYKKYIPKKIAKKLANTRIPNLPATEFVGHAVSAQDRCFVENLRRILKP